jgi:hypothetical protein
MPLGDVRSVVLPYVLQRQSDGRYIVLNREYKPVGFWTRANIVYEDHPVLLKLPGLKVAVAKKLSWNADSNVEEIFLYSDSCVPTSSTANMNAYLERLARLAKLKVPGQVAREAGATRATITLPQAMTLEPGTYRVTVGADGEVTIEGNQQPIELGGPWSIEHQWINSRKTM